MAVLRIRDENGEFQSIPAIKGEPGKDGVRQYTAGKNIEITEDDVINCTVEGGGSTIEIDAKPTINSNNAVSSGGVYTELVKKADLEDVPSKISELENDVKTLLTYTIPVALDVGVNHLKELLTQAKLNEMCETIISALQKKIPIVIILNHYGRLYLFDVIDNTLLTDRVSFGITPYTVTGSTNKLYSVNFKINIRYNSSDNNWYFIEAGTILQDFITITEENEALFEILQQNTEGMDLSKTKTQVLKNVQGVLTWVDEA